MHRDCLQLLNLQRAPKETTTASDGSIFWIACSTFGSLDVTERLKISRLSVSLTRLNSTKEFFSLKIYCKIDFAACLWRCSLTSMISHSLLLTSLPPTIVITFYYFIRDILRSPSENFFIFSLLSCLQREIKTFFSFAIWSWESLFDSTEIRDDNFDNGCEIQWKFKHKHFHASFCDSLIAFFYCKIAFSFINSLFDHLK